MVPTSRPCSWHRLFLLVDVLRTRPGGIRPHRSGADLATLPTASLSEAAARRRRRCATAESRRHPRSRRRRSRRLRRPRLPLGAGWLVRTLPAEVSMAPSPALMPASDAAHAADMSSSEGARVPPRRGMGPALPPDAARHRAPADQAAGPYQRAPAHRRGSTRWAAAHRPAANLRIQLCSSPKATA